MAFFEDIELSKHVPEIQTGQTDLIKSVAEVSTAVYKELSTPNTANYDGAAVFLIKSGAMIVASPLTQRSFT